LLEPKKGWPYLLSALKNTKEDFMFRYAALRAARFLHEYRSDIVSKKEIVDGVCVLLKQEDIADLAIEDLRKWQSWDVADQVLAVGDTSAYKLPIVKRAILRYCLQYKNTDKSKPEIAAKVKAYLEARRKADPEAVKEAEELLKLEQESNVPATPATPKK
jgi:hypothetical protein